MKKIGIIGGGQLGKMMILAGRQLDYHFHILDPTENCPAHVIADKHIVAGFDDVYAIEKLADSVDVVTYEFEHISLKALQDLERKGHKIYPGSNTLSHIQDKYEQKLWLKKNKIPVPAFVDIKSYEELGKAVKKFSFPCMLKTCTGGYDGKGNHVIKSKKDIKIAYEALGGGVVPLMLEEMIKFTKEVSVLACKSLNGDVCVFPIAENLHKNSILDETIVPADISDKTQKEAIKIAKQCLTSFDAVGMLCIELFVTDNGRLLVNELAPRPHNSGHYTIEGCYTSQYEQHIRAICGMPLGDTNLIRPAAMKNIIGDHDGAAEVCGLEKAYENSEVKIHIYGKTQIRAGRKMGHITATADTAEKALKQVRKAHRAITFK